MSREKVKSTMENLLPNLKRLQATKPRIFAQKLALYYELLEGGDGGKLPDGVSLRDLHFADWTARDFALLLAELGEEVEIPEEEAMTSVSVEQTKIESVETPKVGWFSKLFGSSKPKE